jgi:hypothetical protein
MNFPSRAAPGALTIFFQAVFIYTFIYTAPFSEGNTMSPVVIRASGRLGQLVVDQLLAAGTPPAQIVATGIGRPATTAHEPVQNAATIEESR